MNINKFLSDRLPILAVAAISTALFYMAGCSDSPNTDPDLESLYDELDNELERSKIYQNEKELRIAGLKKELDAETSPAGRLGISNRLIDEYESYISDSALHYAERSMEIAATLGDTHQIQALRIQTADIMSHAGLFADAQTALANLRTETIDSALLEKYYSVYCTLYQYMGEYNNDPSLSKEANRMRSLYTDSVVSVTPVHSFNYIMLDANEQILRGNIDSTIRRLTERLDTSRPGTRQYAILASILAYAYKQKGDPENYKRFLTLSAISDTRAVVKENMSFRELSSALFYDGDINRANRYLKKSFEDANFFAARMRTAQSSRMLPVIDEAYNAKQSQLNSRLKWLLVLVGALAIGLAVFIALTLRQMRRTNRANITIRKNNRELSEISGELRKVNDELARTNEALKTSDAVKEEYAGMFMEFSSVTISNLEHYHAALRNLAMQGNVKAILKRLDSNSIADRTLKDFYNNFDDAILNIYPKFVERTNALLRPDEQIHLKSGAKLNTEMRILALIRIGIADTDKIADFLRCSMTTVYTYRSKLRKRAISPDTFEDDIRAID